MVHQNIDAYIRHFVVYGKKHDTDALYDSVKHIFIKLVKKHSKYVVDQEAFKNFTNGQIILRPRIQRGSSSEPEPVPTTYVRAN